MPFYSLPLLPHSQPFPSPSLSIITVRILGEHHSLRSDVGLSAERGTVIRENPTRHATYNLAGDRFHRLVENRLDIIEPPVFLLGIISVFIVCLGIIGDNFLLGWRAQAEVWTPTSERVTLYCTFRPSALTTGLHGQVGSLSLVCRFYLLSENYLKTTNALLVLSLLVLVLSWVFRSLICFWVFCSWSQLRLELLPSCFGFERWSISTELCSLEVGLGLSRAVLVVSFIFFLLFLFWTLHWHVKTILSLTCVCDDVMLYLNGTWFQLDCK